MPEGGDYEKGHNRKRRLKGRKRRRIDQTQTASSGSVSVYYITS